ncbi:hypothetical protein OG594_45960 [Streptomyces sp. NBC_01214]|uniref:hypothetical protein n=1 Tax=Streptomyces sp. NBC_01214 TaxID=2903777 RepID=UPI00224F95F1|nr:hypothetical protein [Streptomyces sp. NBC_01214]MCX4808812.1 hypothetical protein [Streptomyces sp. NBC_01214]
MSTEQYDADAYGQELARISRHRHAATAARSTVFQALAAPGIAPEQADELVSQREAKAVAGAHTWVSALGPCFGMCWSVGWVVREVTGGQPDDEVVGDAIDTR